MSVLTSTILVTSAKIGQAKKKTKTTISRTHGKRKTEFLKNRCFTIPLFLVLITWLKGQIEKKSTFVKTSTYARTKPKKVPNRTQFLLPNLSIYERCRGIFLYFPQTLSPQTNCHFQKQACKQGAAMWPILSFILIHCLVESEKMYGDECKVLRLH